MEDAALWGEISNMNKKNTHDLEIKTENYRNTKMPKYKNLSPKMRRWEVKFPILAKNTTSVWPCIRRGVVEQEICFLQNLNF